MFSLPFPILCGNENKKWPNQTGPKLLKEKALFQKDVTTLKIEISKVSQNTSSDISGLQKTIKLLKLDFKKMINGSKNLDLMLGSQKPYFDKIRLGYEKEDNEKSSKDSQNKIPTCIYYFKKGHTFERCLSRRKARRQNVKNPIKKTNRKGPKKMWVPKVKTISNAGMS